MKINGVPVITTELRQLKAITIEPARNQDEENAHTELYTLLMMKCGGANPKNILDESELTRLPDGRSLIFTYDSYNHLIPRYCTLTWHGTEN